MNQTNGLRATPETIEALIDEARACSPEESPKALRLATRALKLSKQFGYLKGEAESLRFLAVHHHSHSSGSRPVRYGEAALKAFRRLGDSAGEASVLNLLGYVYGRSGQPVRAMALQLESKALAERLQDRRLAAMALVGMANILSSLGNYAQAFEKYDLALAHVKGSPDEALVFNNIGVVHLLQGNQAKALSMFLRSLKLKDATGDTSDIGATLNNIGLIYEHQGEYDKALAYQERCLALARRLGGVRAEASALSGLSSLYEKRGDLAAAIQMQQQALKLERQAGHQYGEAVSCNDLASLYRKLGDRDSAVLYRKRGLRLATAIGDRHTQAQLTAGLAEDFVTGGDSEKAIEVFLRAVQLAERLRVPSLAAPYRKRLADLCKEAHRYEEAIEHYDAFYHLTAELRTDAAAREIKALQLRYELEAVEAEKEALRRKSAELERLSELQRRELEVKSRELTAMALHLVEKTEFLTDLKQHLMELQADKPQAGEPQADEHQADEVKADKGKAEPERKAFASKSTGAVKSALKNAGKSAVRKSQPEAAFIHKLQAHIDRSLNTGAAWRAFEVQFSSVHPDFIRSLSQRCKSLTPTELKVSALIRLNLSTKDIARLLYSSPRSVENHRYHIRRKLALPLNENLSTFLSAL